MPNNSKQHYKTTYIIDQLAHHYLEQSTLLRQNELAERLAIERHAIIQNVHQPRHIVLLHASLAQQFKKRIRKPIRRTFQLSTHHFHSDSPTSRSILVLQHPIPSCKTSILSKFQSTPFVPSCFLSATPESYQESRY